MLSPSVIISKSFRYARTVMKNYYLSLIIPAYNEEKKIEKDIQEAFRFFKNQNITGEVIVSTDGVTDNTNKIVKNLKRNFSDLSLLEKKEKIGKGAAIKRGVLKAQGKYIMFVDAGYCIPFKYIKSGIKKLEEGYDLALGNRGDKCTIIKIKQPTYRKIGSAIFGLLIKYILGVPHYIKDTQCGFKIYKNNVAKKLFNKLQTNGMMFDLEHLLRAKKYGYKIAVFPVEWSNDPDTKFNPITGTIKIFKEIYNIKIKLHL